MNKLGKGPLGNATHQISTSKPSGSEEEDIFIFFYVFLWFEPKSPWHGGHLGPWDLGLNKLGKGPLGNATYQISTSKPSGSEEEDILIFFYVSLWFEPRTPSHWAILDPGTFI